MEKFVLYFQEIDKSSLPYVGGKGANLGEMTRAGFPIPQGFCVTTAAYRALIERSPSMTDFYEQLERISPDDLDEISTLGRKLREHLMSLSMPEDIGANILAAWQAMGQDKAYAVRSSATAEDLPTASFAGQQETYLNVKGRRQLLKAVQQCWASLFTDRAIAYRARNGFDHRSVLLSVVVQEMVIPEVSGIMFTADPITGNRSITSIDASFGLGEALVSGVVSADLYQVRNGRIVQKKIGSKKVAMESNPAGGTVTKELSPDEQEAQALPDDQIMELAQLGQRIEAHYGAKQDIEWCFAQGSFHIVQSRPITSLYPVPPVSDNRLHVFVSVGHQQMMTDAMKPLGMSALRTFFPFGKSGAVRAESPAVVEAGNHLFFDPTDLLYLKPAKKVFPKLLANIDERIGSAVMEVLQRPEFQRPADKQMGKSVFRGMLYFAKTVLPGLLFRDTSKAIDQVNVFAKQHLQECERFIFEATGVERIRRIQDTLGSLIMKLVPRLVFYLPLGIISMKLVEAFAKKWCGDDEQVYLLNKSLRGNVTSELGLLIGDLADTAREYPEVTEYLAAARNETFFGGLRQVRGGDVFAQEFERFMVRYGMRCPGEIDVTNPRWREVPTTLVPSILSHIRTHTQGEHRVKFELGRMEAEQEAARIISKVRQTRGGTLKAKWLSRLIRVYRDTLGLREFPKYVLVQTLDICKRAIMEEAPSLVKQGLLEHESDLFYLSLDEIAALQAGDLQAEVRRLVHDRKKEYERNRKLTPPRVMTSEGEIITGRRREMNVPEGALIGTPVSAGVVEGYAKVILRPEEAKLQPGEIMIAPFTDPGWTPLFHSAKGLVMEVGGMLTHGAVVAREYGIPAVVGIDGATTVIQDGAYIRIDGTRGFVQILQEPVK